MSESIEITINNEEIDKVLEQLASKTSNLSPLMKNLAGFLEDTVEENFENEGRPKWLNISKSTIKQREKTKHWPGKILQKQGNLASSITSYYDSEMAMVGTNKKYAAIHQFGGMAGRNKQVEIPARPFLNLSNQDLSQIKSIIYSYFKEK